jgi:hypothetical protein
MTVYVDIDGTIANTFDGDYQNSTPIYENIEKINKLYDEGNQIIYWTARGATSGIDWELLTKTQLIMWECKFHELKMGKPAFDLLIDDKARKISEI